MIPVTRQDMIVIRMAIDMLFECVRRTEQWCEASEAPVELQQAQKLFNAILKTRRKFVGDDEADNQIANALIVSEGLREAARHCSEGQAALHARLINGADAIERLCKARRS